MKKATSAILVILISLCGISQEKKDTVIVPVFEKYDTVNVLVLYPGVQNTVKYTFGFLIRKGFAKVSDDKKSLQWVSEPQPFSILDDKKKPVTNALKIFY